jgi:tetratricopeptide (TPR) repeat protein
VCYDQAGRDFGVKVSVPVLQRAVDLLGTNHPRSHRIRLYLARLYAASDRVTSALKLYHETLDALPHDAQIRQIDVAEGGSILPLSEVYGHIGLCLYHRLQDFSGAESHFEKALEIAGISFNKAAADVPPPAVPGLTDRGKEWLHECMGLCLLRNVKRQDACEFHLKEKIRHAAARADLAVDVKLHLATLYEVNGRVDESKTLLVALQASTTPSRSEKLEIVVRLGWLFHYCLEDHAKAAACYKTALELERDNAQCAVQAAWCLLQGPTPDLKNVQELYDSAALTVREGRFLPPRRYKIDECFVLGECAVFYHDFVKDIPKAEALYREALSPHRAGEVSVNHSQVAANLAVLLHYEKKDSVQALSYFESALERDPSRKSVLLLFVDFLFATGQAKRAVTEIGKYCSVANAVVDCDVMYRRAKALERSSDNSAEILSQYALIFGISLTPTLETSIADDRLKEITAKLDATSIRRIPSAVVVDVISFLQATCKALPTTNELIQTLVDLSLVHIRVDATFLSHAARFYASRRRWDNAEEAFRMALELDPAHVVTLDWFSEFLVTRYPHRLDLAENCHLQAVRLNPKSAAAHHCFASFLAHVQKTPLLAEHHFRSAVAADPRDPVSLCCYAAFLESHAEAFASTNVAYDTAEHLYRQAIDISPHVAMHHLYLAMFLWRARRQQEAWNAFEAALTRDPKSATVARLAAQFLLDSIPPHTQSPTTFNRRNAPHPPIQLPPKRPESQNSPVFQAAESLLQRVLTIDPMDVSALQLLAQHFEVNYGNVAAAQEIRGRIEAVTARLQGESDAQSE